MAGYGQSGFGGNISQVYEQERIGYGPQGFGVYEQESIINRNPYTGATSIVQESEFDPMRVGGYGVYGQGGIGGNISQVNEQERIGYGPQGFGVYEQETMIKRNPYTGATSIVQENEFEPMRVGGPGGYGRGGSGGNMSQVNEQERIGYGPQGFGVYEQETIINRNPYTGATSIVQQNEFDPMRVGGYGK